MATCPNTRTLIGSIVIDSVVPNGRSASAWALPKDVPSQLVSDQSSATMRETVAASCFTIASAQSRSIWMSARSALSVEADFASPLGTRAGGLHEVSHSCEIAKINTVQAAGGRKVVRLMNCRVSGMLLYLSLSPHQRPGFQNTESDAILPPPLVLGTLKFSYSSRTPTMRTCA